MTEFLSIQANQATTTSRLKPSWLHTRGGPFCSSCRAAEYGRRHSARRSLVGYLLGPAMSKNSGSWITIGSSMIFRLAKRGWSILKACSRD